MAIERYSGHLDTLIALATYLALTETTGQQPKAIAQFLALDDREVIQVLKTFKGLFYASNPKDKNQSAADRYYTLLWRYAGRAGGEKNCAPLKPEHLVTLLEFIFRKANEEEKQSVSIKVALLTAILSLAASIASIAFTFLKPH